MSTGLLRALAHGHESVVVARALGAGHGVEATAIVGHCECHVCDIVVQTHRHGRPARVTHGVQHRLLTDAK